MYSYHIKHRITIKCHWYIEKKLKLINYQYLVLLSFVRREDGNAFTEPDESVYDEINVEEEKNTRGNSYLDVNEGYDELGQRSPTNPYNQLQQTRDDIQRRDIKNNEMNADDQLQNNKRRNDYLSLFSGYEKPISRNDTQN